MTATTASRYAGCRQATRNRQTGTLIFVFHAAEQGLDDDEGRQPWSTVCDEHGTVCSHENLATARAFAASPLDWCEDCMAASEGE